MYKTPLIVLALCSTYSFAETINVADHGVLPSDDDVTLEVYQLIDSLEGKEGITLYFPKGEYNFFPDNAFQEWREVSNHDNSLRHMALPIYNLKDVTIDGGGSTFMFHGRISPIVVESSENVTLKNLSIDWARPFQNEMYVVENDPEKNTFIVEIDAEQYPYEIKNNTLLFNYYDWQDTLGSNMAFDPATRSPMYNTRDYSLRNVRKIKVEAAGKNRVKFTKATRKTPPVGTMITSYGNHPTSRLAQVIHLSNSKDLFIENVTLYAGGGMGIIAERCENITIDGYKVTSTDDRMISTRADASHFINCKGTILMQNSLMEHMLDDAINVHGSYIKIEELVSDNQILCEISHFQQTGLVFAEPGDKVALLSRTTILPFFETTVEDIQVLNEKRVLITLADAPTEIPEGPLSIENITWNPDLIFRDNIVRENRARSVLVTTKGKVLIENNYFSSQMHSILIEGDNKFWYESGAVEDITIQNNTFVNIGYEGGDRYVLNAAPLLLPEQHQGEGYYHRNINFVNNTIKGFSGQLVYAFYTKGLNVSGNTVELVDDYPRIDEFPAFDIKYCDDVTIENNKFTGFGKDLKIEVSKDSSNVKIANNKGIR